MCAMRWDGPAAQLDIHNPHIRRAHVGQLPRLHQISPPLLALLLHPSLDPPCFLMMTSSHRSLVERT